MLSRIPSADPAYQINTEVYQGPLDLLLDLIEKAQLDITKIALAQVTDQYLAYLKHIEDRDPAQVSAFLVIAAKLVQIKSAALLPRPSVPSFREDEEGDPGEDLARQLLIYKRFKELSQFLDERQQKNLRTYIRIGAVPLNIDRKVDLSDLNLDDFLLAAREVFFNEQTQADLSSVIHLPRVTIREKMSSIRSYLDSNRKGTFSDLLNSTNRVEIIITFLALLELIKRHWVSASQDTLFSNIQFETSGNASEWVDEELGIID